MDIQCLILTQVPLCTLAVAYCAITYLKFVNRTLVSTFMLYMYIFPIYEVKIFVENSEEMPSVSCCEGIEATPV